jgi:hypothetical protein
MTHDDLVKLAERWVRRTQRRYPVILSDVRMNASNEQPDVFAAGVSGTLLIECKTSRADFAADALKPFRRDPSMGVGEARYYCAPRGVLTADDLPDDWGLLEPNVKGTSLGVALRAPRFFAHTVNWRAERTLLVGALQRATDGDPHPSVARILRELREKVLADRDELVRLRRRVAELEAP